MIFLLVLLGIVLFIVGIGGFMLAIIGFTLVGPDGLFRDGGVPGAVLAHVGGAVLCAACITVGITVLGPFMGNDCGPGTHAENDGGGIIVGKVIVPTTHCVAD